jgi:cardiolipin synthase
MNGFKTSLVSLLPFLVLGSGCVSTAPPMSAESAPEVFDRTGWVSDERAASLVEDLVDDAPDHGAFTDLLNATASLSDAPLFLDNKVELLIDGPGTYSSMLDAIATAEDFIYLETYIFADDKVGRTFADALAARSREGITVRLIFDSIGSLLSGDDIFAEMRDAGIAILEYNDINPLDGGNPTNFNNRDHRKLLIVDGRVAFTGGINISNTYSSRPGQQKSLDLLADGWRDTHVAVFGPAVAGLVQVFEDNWQLYGGSLGRPVAVSQHLEDAGNDSIVVLAAKGGSGDESSIYHAYLNAIELARDKVWLTQAYFVPDKDLLAALNSAAARGVDVRIVVPGVSDSKLVINASRSRYSGLLKSGVRIYETTNSVLHAKTAVVDGVWSTVGSSNLDSRSALHNDEVNVVVFGADFGRQMELQFESDIQNSRAIPLDAWRQRPLYRKFLETISRPFAYWI